VTSPSSAKVLDDPDRALSRRPIADLESLTLEDDFDAARKCKVSVRSQASRSAVERLQKEMDWKAPTPGPGQQALMKQMLAEYVTAYQRGGTTEMATYATTRRRWSRPSSGSWPRRPTSWNTLPR
jgi:hypothetical protein